MCKEDKKPVTVNEGYDKKEDYGDTEDGYPVNRYKYSNGGETGYDVDYPASYDDPYRRLW